MRRRRGSGSRLRLLVEPRRELEREKVRERLCVWLVLLTELVEPLLRRRAVDVLSSRAVDDGEQLFEVGIREAVDRNGLETELKRQVGQRMAAEPEAGIRGGNAVAARIRARQPSRAEEETGAGEESRREGTPGDCPLDEAVTDQQPERPDDELRDERERPEQA